MKTKAVKKTAKKAPKKMEKVKKGKAKASQKFESRTITFTIKENLQGMNVNVRMDDTASTADLVMVMNTLSHELLKKVHLVDEADYWSL